MATESEPLSHVTEGPMESTFCPLLSLSRSKMSRLEMILQSQQNRFLDSLIYISFNFNFKRAMKRITASQRRGSL